MFDLSHWPYIDPPKLSGDLKSDIERFLIANNREKTAKHCISVAAAITGIAERFELNVMTASTAALLHDISGVMRPMDMYDYAVAQSWQIDPAEQQHPFLLHQTMSAIFAKELFGVDDETVLSAIACHSTLKASPSDYDMALFLADKLSWDQQGIPPFYDLVSSALNVSLPHAALTYIRFVLAHNMILHPHRWLIEAEIWLQSTCSLG